MRLRKGSALALSLALAVPMAAVTAFATQLPAGESAETVTLDAPGWSLNHILAVVSKQTGLNLKASGDCGSDYLVVRVNHVPWPDFKLKLAWIEYGKWEGAGSSLVIERDPSLVQAQVKAENESRVEYLTAQFASRAPKPSAAFDANKFIDRLSDNSEKQYLAEWTARDPNQSAPAITPKLRTRLFFQSLSLQSRATPMGIAVARMINDLPVQALATFHIGESLVYSTQPTALQLPFPPAAMAAYKEGLAENRELQKATWARGIVPSSVADPDDPLGLFHWPTFLLPGGSFGPLIVRVFRYNGGSLSITPYWYLRDGEVDEYLDSVDINGQGSAEQNSFPSPGTMMTIQKGAVRDWQAMRNFALGTLSTSLRYKLKHPQEYDPLSLTIAPIVAAMPRSENVIVRDDGLMNQLTYGFELKKPNLVPSDLFHRYQEQGLCQVQSSRDWVAVRDFPNNFGEFNRLPRGSYAELVSSISNSGALPFASVLKFVKTLGPHLLPTIDLAGTLTSALTNRDNGLPAYIGDYQYCLFLTSLNPTQWHEAFSKKGLAVDNLTGLPLTRLMSFLLNGHNGMVSNSDYYLGKDFPMMTIYDDPTVAFAHGLPRMVLKLTKKHETAVFFNSSVSIGMNEVIDQRTIPVSEFGSYTNGSVSGATMETPDLSRLYLATQHKLTASLVFLTYNYNPISTDFITYSFHPHEYHNWHHFPASIRKKIKAGQGS